MKRSSPARRSGRSRLTESQVSAVTPTTTTTTDTIPLNRNFPSAIPPEGMTRGRFHVARLLRCSRAATWLIACSAIAVIVRLGLTPTLAGIAEPSQTSRFS